MDEIVAPNARPSRARRYGTRLLVGCGVVALATVASIGGLWWYLADRAARLEAQALAEQAEKADDAFKPALDKLGVPAAPEPEPVDIDKTIRVIHEIDLALRSYDDFESYLQHLGHQDYRGVAPEVLDARRDLLDEARELYALQTEANEQQALWDYTKGMMLEVLSVVEAEGEWGVLGPTGSFSLDRDHAREVLAEFREQQSARARQIRDIGEARDELFDAMIRYSDVYYTHVEQWDRLCVLRDRAYLAAVERDWVTVEASAKAAIEMAPQEREAHLRWRSSSRATRSATVRPSRSWGRTWSPTRAAPRPRCCCSARWPASAATPTRPG